MQNFDRNAALLALTTQEFDVVVIGAGMTGAGVALDAAQRGLRVALIDKGDVASGTSSKSSKMVHGGLRYLQQREFRLVYENLRERQRLLQNAPHLVRVLPFLIPLFGKDGAVAKVVSKGYASALRLYDLTGGVRIGRRYQRVTRAEALAHLPTLNVGTLAAGFLYFDARGDDARVALTIARTAATYGAVVANYVCVDGFTHDDAGRVGDVRVRDVVTNESFLVRTRLVVNASGVWADEIARLAARSDEHTITPAKGVHLSVPSSRLPADVAAVMSVPGDRRSIFVVPFEDAPFTFIGTTDTHYEGPLDSPDCESDDVDYLLRTVNYWTSSNLTREDVTGVWAGLRPLLSPKKGAATSERTADLSRRHRVDVSDDGVVHIVGGKWTTYRQMAEDTVDKVCSLLGHRRSVGTRSLALFGAPSRTYRAATTEGLERHLYRRFGTEKDAIERLIEEDPTLGEPAIEGQPYVKAEFIYSASEELVVTLVDLLARRTRAHLHDARATLRAAHDVATLVAPVLGWDDVAVREQVSQYAEIVQHEFAAAGLNA